MYVILVQIYLYSNMKDSQHLVCFHLSLKFYFLFTFSHLH